MILQRLMEAAMRLRSVTDPTFTDIAVEVAEKHAITHKTDYKLQSRKASIQVYRTTMSSGTSSSGWVQIGSADIDINGMVTKINYDVNAPYWAVRPFVDALEGK